MNSFRDLLNLYREEFINNSNYETLKFYLFELANQYKINLYLEMENNCPLNLEKQYHQGVKRLLKNEPLAYVLGYCFFNGNQLKVNSDVLIPRYETEELVMNILIESDHFFKDYQEIKAVDIGSGSGAIAISLAKDEAKFKMIATDISAKALDILKINSILNDVELEVFYGNMLEPLIERKIKVDLLISNPPYIPETEELEDSVKCFEPHIALFGGKDGLKYYKEILSNCHYILNNKAMLAFEIAYNQKEAIYDLAKQYLKDFEFNCIKDINQKDRIVIIKINKN